MTMSESPCLLLIAVEPGHSIPQDTSMEEILMKLPHLELEDPGHNVWSVGSNLSREDVADNVLVPSKTGNGDEEGEGAKDPDD